MQIILVNPYLTSLGGGGGGSPTPGEALESGTWDVAYSDTVATTASNGAEVTGLPYGLSGSVTGGVLTVSGTPQ